MKNGLSVYGIKIQVPQDLVIGHTHIFEFIVVERVAVGPPCDRSAVQHLRRFDDPVEQPGMTCVQLFHELVLDFLGTLEFHPHLFLFPVLLREEIDVGRFKREHDPEPAQDRLDARRGVFLLQIQRRGKLLERRDNKNADKESEQEHDDRDQDFHDFAPEFEWGCEVAHLGVHTMKDNITSYARVCKSETNKKTVKSEKK